MERYEDHVAVFDCFGVQCFLFFEGMVHGNFLVADLEAAAVEAITESQVFGLFEHEYKTRTSGIPNRFP